uniref:Uncharacterized protein n=1 Tax=Arundo donax TaxID=35708 RepID=A0A0A9GRN9_ARUDO
MLTRVKHQKIHIMLPHQPKAPRFPLSRNCAFVEWIRRTRCCIVGLLRLPPKPRQFQLSRLMVLAAPLRLAPWPIDLC